MAAMNTEPMQIGTRRLRHHQRPWLMGIVNVTPDSFSDGGLHTNATVATEHALQLVAQGADLIDLGGESTRPGAAPVSVNEELARILPVLEQLRSQVDVPISVDTMKSEVARAALLEGADMINDVSALRFDLDMPRVLADSRCSVVLMHMQGEPRTMQQEPRYDDVVGEVSAFLRERIDFATHHGIDANRLYVDVGIGFGKRLEHNLTLLRELAAIRALGHRMVLGASRKRFLGELLDEPQPDQRLEGDLAVAAWSQQQGVEILRVHDVRATHRLRTVLDAIRGA
jgi:dihydropteroate synthase